MDCHWLTATPTFDTYVCKDGYGGTAGTCAACTIADCALCQGDKAVCDTCKPGFYKDTTCKACTNSKALTCSAVDTDTECKPGNCLGDKGGKAFCYTCPANCIVGSATT